MVGERLIPVGEPRPRRRARPAPEVEEAASCSTRCSANGNRSEGAGFQEVSRTLIPPGCPLSGQRLFPPSAGTRAARRPYGLIPFYILLHHVRTLLVCYYGPPRALLLVAAQALGFRSTGREHPLDSRPGPCGVGVAGSAWGYACGVGDDEVGFAASANSGDKRRRGVTADSRQGRR